MLNAGFSQRHYPATGELCDDYSYSVNVDPAQWSELNFEVLGMIDVVEALAQFDPRHNMSKIGMFKAIDPS